MAIKRARGAGWAWCVKGCMVGGHGTWTVRVRWALTTKFGQKNSLDLHVLFNYKFVILEKKDDLQDKDEENTGVVPTT